MTQISGMVQVMEVCTDSTLHPGIITCLRVMFPVQHLEGTCIYQGLSTGMVHSNVVTEKSYMA